MSSRLANVFVRIALGASRLFIILKIALRNLFAHKIKTLIIGTLIFLGVFISVLGNSILDSMQGAMKKAYSKTLTGQIGILKHINYDFSLFGTWTNVGNLRVPQLPSYFETVDYLKNHPGVKNITPMSSGYAVINLGDNDDNEWLLTLGIEPASFTQMFDIKDTIILSQGSFLKQEEEGIVLPETIVEMLEKYRGVEIKAGDKILLNGYSTNGFRIREVPVRGIFRFRYLKGGIFPMLERTCFLDVQNFRILNGYTKTTEQEIVIQDDTALTEDWDTLFSDPIEEGEIITGSGAEEVAEILGNLQVRHQLSQVDSGAWEWILVQTKDQSDNGIRSLINEFSSHFDAQFKTFKPDDFTDFPAFIGLLKNSNKGAYRELKRKFLPVLQKKIQDFNVLNDIDPFFKARVAEQLNQIIRGPLLYDKEVYQDIYLSKITKDLAKSNPQNGEQIRVNRLLLEDLFPHELKRGPDLMVSEWWHAAAPMSTITMGIQWVLNAAIIIIVIVASIIIMNTLVISIVQRTAEIGTMRALGGQKGFVFRMFLSETFTISLAFGLLGLIAGYIVISLFNMIGIPAEQGSAMEILFAGTVLRPTIPLTAIISSILAMLGIGLLSSLYPVIVALRIQPLEAIRSE